MNNAANVGEILAKEVFPQRTEAMLREVEEHLWRTSAKMVTFHVGEVFGACLAEFVRAAKNKGMVSYRVPGEQTGETRYQDTTP
eukprot:7199055-Lingulodinium_polyedra.AAC.1